MEDLHPDLLGLILHRLPISDYVRSGAVCRSWRRATAENHRSTRTPWLMFPTLDKGSAGPESFRFFTIPDLTLHRFNLPQILGKRIAGSSNGFIVAADPTGILLLDPITSSKVLLPPATLFNSNGELEYPMVMKVVFSSSSWTALALCIDSQSARHCLSFVRFGNNAWTPLCEGTPFRYADVIIHGGVFLVVDFEGTLLSFDPSDGTHLVTREFSAAPFIDYYDWLYLAESLDGEHFFLVCRRSDGVSCLVESFKVFRLDKAGNLWVEAGSLGEVAVFVGCSYSTCVFTRGVPGMRGNCVYFTDVIPTHRDDFGLFDLGDGSIHQLVALQQVPPGAPSPFWIMPSSS